ncbi:cell division protein ZapC [Psychrosphaera sp. B3R10]|uniref:Cell division protein ZapC n=1 Tax=Psychrosphaera algicola TaxID=3023714 RepID=A0ABT5F982_9GAMM|nr:MULTISPECIES: cell division protein ZapC domain-containing protein [unclassified Psychrosphaera]MBU2881291.1 cell division protein ZapC [Psychrosphaera sp. I2R16]MBU2988390.1 cell division protein ZapC [Psychrosphaera sp. B3R10]MDC2888091.1 cell division protein ZapC [Psychrosphaera sp. G1-22]MDO6720110.1 cell division protein ZapC [Psychrosphaera sp. 1_MG-2023]
MQNVANNGVNWWWHLSPNDRQLILHLSSEIGFPTGFKLDSLVEKITDGMPFSTSDAEVYSGFCELFSQMDFNAEQRFKLAIFATVGTLYIKPMAAKSWYFRFAKSPTRTIKPRQLVKLSAYDSAVYIVLTIEDNASYVMLISERHNLNETKDIKRGHVIKVHNDRLTPVDFKLQGDQL